MTNHIKWFANKYTIEVPKKQLIFRTISTGSKNRPDLQKEGENQHPKWYYKGMSLEQNEGFFCPYCGENNGLSVDISGGPNQQFVLDCEICCAPILVRVKVRGGLVVSIDAQRENE